MNNVRVGLAKSPSNSTSGSQSGLLGLGILDSDESNESEETNDTMHYIIKIEGDKIGLDLVSDNQEERFICTYFLP